MAIRRKSGIDRYDACQSYLVNRIRGLTIPPVAVGVKLNADNQVYGAVIDMPMGRDLLTTGVFLMNGSANLYFNTGGGVLGMGRHQPVSTAVRAFLVNAGQCLPSCEHVREFDLPTLTTHYIYLLTRRGVYKMSLNPNTILTEPDDNKKLIFSMYQRVLNEVRNAQLKERADAQKRGGSNRIVLNSNHNAPNDIKLTNVTVTKGNAKPLNISGLDNNSTTEE